ncbi:MAG TPA: MATE family efflux transporter [Bacillota bacterium]|nr:MATE family efflux transporter [Bacillota bacterium]HOG53444.1 MATE family efflux transporter [Bacillota bacterium]
MAPLSTEEEALDTEMSASPLEGTEDSKGDVLDYPAKRFKSRSVVLDRDAVDHLEKHPERLQAFVLRLALPAIADNVLATVTQMADMIMVGKLGAGAVASVGLSNQPLFLIQGLFMGIGIGVTAVVARMYGAGRRREANHVSQQMLIFSFLLSALLCGFWYIFVPQIVSFMGAQPDVLGLGVTYMRTIVPGLFILTVNMIMSSALRGAGDTRSPMVANIAINVLNIIGNYALIFGNFGFPAMGVKGAALATTLSRTTGTLILFYIMTQGRGVLELTAADGFRLEGVTLKRVLKVGLPTAAERVSLSLGITFYTRIVASLGTITYAAHQIAINAEQISFMPGFGFATAATALVGQALGAGSRKMAERAGWTAWKMGAILSGLLGLILLFWPEALMRLYVEDPEIIRLGSMCLRIMALAQIPMSTGLTIVGALRGAGDTRAVLYLTMFSVWIVRFVGSIIAVKTLGLGLFGAWIVMALDWYTRAAVFILRWKAGHWKERKV